MREYLKELRNAKSLTQKEVAGKLGISQNYYSCIENGLKQKKIDLWLMVDMAKLFGVDINYLIEEEAKVVSREAV